MRYFYLILLLLLNIAYAQKQHILDESKMKAEILKKWAQPSGITENQAGYDVKYYLIDLDIEANPDRVQGIRGSVTVNLDVVDANLASVDLNLADGMIADSVFNENTKTSFTRGDDILTVTLKRNFARGEATSVTVFYHGNPEATGFGAFGFTEYNNKPLVWSLSEPYGARAWWPCKDAPADKADSVDIRFTLPDPMIAVSNGVLAEKVANGNGTTTFFWKERHPISTYLVSIAAYEYVKYTDWYVPSENDSMPIDFYVAPGHLENSKVNFLKTREMIEIFADLFGEYPFLDEKYGHVEFPWGGGMEHQTCTSLGNINYSNGYYSINLIVHELAHQWWGDMVTCADFKNIWLNEGFATYSEALYWEAIGGFERYQDEIGGNAYYGGGTIYVDDTTSVSRIFHSGLSYNKASYVLHMLRHVVGDSTFFTILKTYYEDSKHQYSTVTTPQFQELCETVSGMDLEKFFQQWIYGEYYPYYSYGWAANAQGDNYKITLEIKQIQTNTGLFKMPVDVEIKTPTGTQIFVVRDSLASQTFELTVGSEPTAVTLDPDNWILKDVARHPLTLPGDDPVKLPDVFEISGIFPNPFNPVTTIEFYLPASTPVSVSIYDILGKKVATLADKQNFSRGTNQIKWNALNRASGIYFARVQAGESTLTRKLVLTR
ncbi:MAG: M1 family aminopeptidase [Calditrichaceae bacterium]